MFEIIKAGGWVMAPLILCSVIVAAIIAERFWTLQAKRVAPEHLAAQVWHWIRNGEFDEERMQALRTGTPLGRLLAIALLHRNSPRDVLNDAIADAGRHIVHELDRYLITLGTIATISPLLGLLGTVLGIMRVFAAISQVGLGNPAALAGGISEALITTVVGLGVAIPAYVAHRYLRGRVDELVVSMERETMRLMNALQGKQAPAEWQRRVTVKLRERARWEDPELNLISLVDVVLMLLVFFMMTTHFIENTSLTVALPSAGAPPSFSKLDGIEVTVDAEGHYYVNQKAVPDTTPTTLRDALVAVAGDRRDQPIVLRADARSTHQSVVTVMDVAGALGFAQLQILTTQPQANH